MDESYGGAKPKTRTPRRNPNVPDTKYSNGQTSPIDKSRSSTNANSRPLFHKEVVSKGNHSVRKKGDDLQKTFINGNVSKSDPPLGHEDKIDNSGGLLTFKEDHFDKDEVCLSRQYSERSSNVVPCKRSRGTGYDRQFIREFLPLTDELIQNAVKGACSGGLDGPMELKQLTSDFIREPEISNTGEPLACRKKKKELSAREKWKKSGHALRKYLSTKFGFGDVTSPKNHHKKVIQNCVINSDGGTDKNMQHQEQNSNGNVEENEQSSSQTNPISRSSSSTSTGSDGKKEWSMPFLRLFDSHKEKHKEKNDNHLKVSKSKVNKTKTDLSSSPSPYSPAGDTDSDWLYHSSLTNESAQQRSSICDCDWSMKMDSKRECTCDWSFRSHDQKGPISDNLVQLKCDRSSQCRNLSNVKVKKVSKKLERNNQRKPLVGLLDHALKSSSETENEKTKPITCAKRRRRKSKESSRNGNHAERTEQGNRTENIIVGIQSRIDETRNQVIYGNQPVTMETEGAGPMRSFVLTGKPQGRQTTRLSETKHRSQKSQQKGSDVLLGLKYALPYLPERLRNRLHSSSNEHDDKQLSSLETNLNSSSNGHSYKCSPSLETNSRNILHSSSSEHIDEYSPILEKKSNHGNKVQKLDVKQTDAQDKVGMSNNLKKHVCDTKFHLNASGTWTMTKVCGQCSDSDLEEGEGHGDHECQGCFHNNRLWSPLRGQIEEETRDTHIDWLRLREDLVQLEASIEDPFNLRGDNLLLVNASPPKEDNSWNYNEDNSVEKGNHSFDSYSLTKGNKHAGYISETPSPKGINSSRFRGDQSTPRYSHSKGDNPLNFYNWSREGESYKETKGDNQMDMCSGLLDLVYGMDDSFEREGLEDNRFISENGDTIQNGDSDEFIARKVAEIIEGDSDDCDLDTESLNGRRSLFDFSDGESFSSGQSQSYQTLNSTSEFCWDPFNTKFTGDESLISVKLPDDRENEPSLVRKCGNSIDDLCSGLLRMSPNDDVEQGAQSLVSHSSTIDDLDMVRSRSWSLLTHESSLDADDEFECDCEHCLSLRYATFNQGSDLNSSQRFDTQIVSGSDDIVASDYFRLPESLNVGIGVSELSSLDVVGSELGQGLGVMLENVILQLLADNVIMQMIAVRPDLFSDQAPPPATQSIIDDIPTICMSQEDLDQNPVCPVCLCPCILEETMSRLPCQHIFHPICVQAWLVKSGTCPVCRYRVTP